jgi:hypothetical protein
VAWGVGVEKAVETPCLTTRRGAGAAIVSKVCKRTGARGPPGGCCRRADAVRWRGNVAADSCVLRRGAVGVSLCVVRDVAMRVVHGEADGLTRRWIMRVIVPPHGRAWKGWNRPPPTPPTD